MLKLPGERTDAAEVRDDGSMIHVRNVHSECTSVNVECVAPLAHNAFMANAATTGEILRGLMTRAGLTVREFSKGAGYATGSGVQRFIEPDFDGPLQPKIANKLADALEGRGTQPVTRAEVMALTGIDGVFEAQPNDVLAPRYLDLARDVPAYGTAIGTFSENEMIEQSIINYDDPVDFFIRPPGVVKRKGIYGLYIAGESQAPRFKPGELIFVDPGRTPMIGDDVVIYIKRAEGDEEALAAILVKELVRRTPTTIHLRQLRPEAEFSIDARKVMSIHRVLTNADLYGGYR